MSDRRPVSVELMRTLDEKFIANAIAFEAARPTAALIVDGGPLRLPDGSLDREGIRRHLEASAWQLGPLHHRLRPSPLRLTTPGWVPVDRIDGDWHVRFVDGVIVDREEIGDYLAGRRSGAMSLKAPLWDFTVLEIASGDVVVVGRIQHALGDGVFGVRLLDTIVSGMPQPLRLAVVGPASTRGPRSGIEFLLVAGRDWLKAFPLGRPAWKEYWRKPVRKRIARWGGRLLRPLRNREIARRGLVSAHMPQRHSDFRSWSLPAVRRMASKLGGTVSDLTIAIALTALQAATDGDSALMVPVSRRRGASTARNHISMVRVSIPRGVALADAVALVHSAIEQGASAPTPPADSSRSGYASYLPWQVRRRYLGPAELRAVTLWPVLEPGDRVAVFGSSYAGVFSLAVTASTDILLQPFFDAIEAAITEREAA